MLRSLKSSLFIFVIFPVFAQAMESTITRAEHNGMVSYCATLTDGREIFASFDPNTNTYSYDITTLDFRCSYPKNICPEENKEDFMALEFRYKEQQKKLEQETHDKETR